MAKEVAGHAALIEKLKISPYRVGLQWVVESMLMGRYVMGRAVKELSSQLTVPAIPLIFWNCM